MLYRIANISIKTILLPAVCFSFLLSCSSTAAGRQCRDFNWDKTREAVLFGRVITGKELLLESTNRQQYLLCGASSREIKQLKAGYLFARGRVQAGKGDAEAVPFLVEEILLTADAATPDWSEAEQVRISGLLEAGRENNITLVTNWNSKSRISHYILGRYGKQLRAEAGRYAQLRCFLIQSLHNPNPWVKEIVVDKIYAVADRPPGG